MYVKRLTEASST